ncbi:hypothetical protein E2562_038797 [Oryza meyeriana var. granulata]|uniref:Uncharacterized protein n=1 Tax=Oryza meyeriana var. granulata TaxID=110450 RepID=A0A6G1CM45_9ORYZ|nr:hypothetical protein E2562_038797 [Oryza meyeriana var. granulata]
MPSLGKKGQGRLDLVVVGGEERRGDGGRHRRGQIQHPSPSMWLDPPPAVVSVARSIARCRRRGWIHRRRPS